MKVQFNISIVKLVFETKISYHTVLYRLNQAKQLKYESEREAKLKYLIKVKIKSVFKLIFKICQNFRETCANHSGGKFELSLIKKRKKLDPWGCLEQVGS